MKIIPLIVHSLGAIYQFGNRLKYIFITAKIMQVQKKVLLQRTRVLGKFNNIQAAGCGLVFTGFLNVVSLFVSTIIIIVLFFVFFCLTLLFFSLVCLFKGRMPNNVFILLSLLKSEVKIRSERVYLTC